MRIVGAFVGPVAAVSFTGGELRLLHRLSRRRDDVGLARFIENLCEVRWQRGAKWAKCLVDRSMTSTRHASRQCPDLEIGMSLLSRLIKLLSDHPAAGKPIGRCAACVLRARLLSLRTELFAAAKDAQKRLFRYVKGTSGYSRSAKRVGFSANLRFEKSGAVKDVAGFPIGW